MNFINYIENKIFYILFQLLTIITLSVMLNIANVNKYYVIYIAVLLIMFTYNLFNNRLFYY